jgi:phage regulatory protein, rha family
MNELMNVEIRNTLTSLEVAEITGKRHDNILSDIRDEISKLGAERGLLIFQETYYVNEQNRQKYPMFNLNYKGVLQLGARYNAETRFRLIEKIEQLQKPMTVEDMIILQANEMKSVKHRIDIVENKVDNEIRIDHTEQRKLQKAVSIRVYQRLDVVDAERKLMFSAIYRDLKDRFGVASYRDVKRKDLKNALLYVQNWIEKAELRN